MWRHFASRRAAASAVIIGLLIAGALLAINWPSNDGARAAYNVSDPITGTVDSVDIDVDTTGNTATSVDSVQTAISVPLPVYAPAVILTSSTATQKVFTTATAHGLTTGDWVLIAGHNMPAITITSST